MSNPNFPALFQPIELQPNWKKKSYNWNSRPTALELVCTKKKVVWEEEGRGKKSHSPLKKRWKTLLSTTVLATCCALNRGDKYHPAVKWWVRHSQALLLLISAYHRLTLCQFKSTEIIQRLFRTSLLIDIIHSFWIPSYSTWDWKYLNEKWVEWVSWKFLWRLFKWESSYFG